MDKRLTKLQILALYEVSKANQPYHPKQLIWDGFIKGGDKEGAQFGACVAAYKTFTVLEKLCLVSKTSDKYDTPSKRRYTLTEKGRFISDILPPTP